MTKKEIILTEIQRGIDAIDNHPYSSLSSVECKENIVKIYKLLKEIVKL